MVTVDLITGFLGAGKTTFIHGYLHFLQQQNINVKIIENEFGDVSVDTELLEDEHCDIMDLTGLCMCCVGKDAFIKMLKESATNGCDRIIVEPSGIYDVDEFFEVMSLPDISELCEIGSIITIADPLGMEYVTDESKYLMFGQFLASGIVLLSKAQMLSEEQLLKAKNEIDDIMKEKGCDSGLLSELFTKSWDEFTDEDYEEIMDSGYNRLVHDREEFIHDEVYQSMEINACALNQEELSVKISQVFNSDECGKVLRIKGHAQDAAGKWYEINCTAETASIRSINSVENKTGNMVIIGQRLRRKEVRKLLS